MSLTPLRKRKLGRMFSVLDLDGDGFVEQADFTRRVRSLARIRMWQPGMPEYARNLRFALHEWENLRESADADRDSRITRDEFLRYADIYLSDPEAVRAYASGDVQLLFDAMDTDGDGRITEEEYRVYLDACGVPPAAAATFFARADLDGDGRITRAEMAHAVEEFLLSEDPEAGGNLLFGPLDGEADPDAGD